MIHPPGDFLDNIRSDSVTPPVAGRQPSRRVCAGHFLRAVVPLEIRFVLISSFVILSEANRASILCKILSQGALPFQTGIGCFALLNMTRTSGSGNAPQTAIGAAVRSVFERSR